jgi:hypothetical protein
VRVLYYADVLVVLESADGAPHRVRVRIETPPGLQAPDPAEVAVPATGRGTATVRVWRSSAPRGSRQDLVVIAESIDVPPPPSALTAPASTLATTPVTATILPDPAWMPRLRRPLGVLALLLMAAAALLELRRRWPVRPSSSPSATLRTGRGSGPGPG